MTRSQATPSPTTNVKYRAVLLFGAPGSGKGTQGKIVGSIPGFLHSSTGDLFRALDRQSEMGKIFVQYSSRGELVPDEFTIKLWKQHMQALVAGGKFKPTTDVVVMDGVPRNVKQAELLSDSIEVTKILSLDASNLDRFVQRLKLRAQKENRSDDADENVIRNRMAVYQRETQPVLDFYPANRVARIEADQSIIRVLADVLNVLVPLTEK